jgi:hypothetical protein
MAIRTDGGLSYFPVGVTSGLIGVATTPGTYNFTIQVKDNASNSTTLACTMTISSLAATNPSQLSDGFVNQSGYSYQMQATGITGERKQPAARPIHQLVGLDFGHSDPGRQLWLQHHCGRLYGGNGQPLL